MNATQATEIYGEALRQDAEEIMELAMSAVQNVVDTTGMSIGYEFTGEQADIFAGSVRDLLSSRETTEETREWFAARGLTH